MSENKTTFPETDCVFCLCRVTLADVARICLRQNRTKVRRSEKGIEQEAIEPSQN